MTISLGLLMGAALAVSLRGTVAATSKVAIEDLANMSQATEDAIASAIRRGGVRGDDIREPLPTASDAARIAERIIAVKFGAAELRRQLPLKVTDDGDNWKVEGAAVRDILTGPVLMIMRKSSAEVVELSRTGPAAPKWPPDGTSKP